MSDVDFDYLTYARERTRQYHATKGPYLAAAAAAGGAAAAAEDEELERLPTLADGIGG